MHPWLLAPGRQAWGKLCCLHSFIPLGLVGSRENLVVTGCRTSLSLPSPHPWKQRGLSERVGWLVSSFLSFLNAQQNLPCLLQALPAAPPATRGPSTLPRNKCSLPTTTNQVSLFCFQPSTDSSLPWGGRREGRAHPIAALRKGPSPRSPGKGGEGWALHCQQQEEIATTAHLNCKFSVKPPAWAGKPTAALPVPSTHELRPTLGRAGGVTHKWRQESQKGWLWGLGLC